MSGPSEKAAVTHDEAVAGPSVPPPGSVTFDEEEEPEPLSFAPRRHWRSEHPQSTGSGTCVLPTLSRRDDQKGSWPPPPSIGRASRTSEVGDATGADLEVLSMRFGHSAAPVEPEPRGDALWLRVQAAVRETSAELLQRSLTAATAQERARFVGYSESLDKLLVHPSAAKYVMVPGVAEGLLDQLRRLQAAQRTWPANREYSDILLRTTVTSIHLAPCLGYWRSKPEVPAAVKKLLIDRDVYGSALKLAKTRKSKEVDQFITEYTDVVGALAKRPEINLKVRNPIIWPWCKLGIEQVAYTFRWPDEARGDRQIDDAFTDVKLLLVLFNVLVDDTADNVQDPELVGVLGAIPTAGGAFGVASQEGYDALRRQLARIGREQFEPYFDLTVAVWKHTFERLRELSGAAFDTLAPQLARDYVRLIDSMRLSVDLNTRPAEAFRYDAQTLQRKYGGPEMGEILAHNSNGTGFHTIDLLRLLANDPARYRALAESGALWRYRRIAELFQEMHHMGNCVATGAREAESDDLSNELFELANIQLNATRGWELPEHLAGLLGPEREDVLLRAFCLKKEAKRRRAAAKPGTSERQAAHDEYLRLSDDIQQLIAVSGSERVYFDGWLERRTYVSLLMAGAEIPDREALLAGNDMGLVMHLIYKGKI